MKKTKVRINFPSQFSVFINDAKQIAFEGTNVADFLAHLDKTYGNISERLLQENKVRPYMNIYIGDKNINVLQGLNSIIPEGEKVSLLLSRAGG